eukprot:PhM_4_TR2883/c0_g3_i1/m.44440
MLTEEFLLAAGKEYERRAELRRRAKEADEMKEVRDKPAISEFAKNMVRSSSGLPVEARLLRMWKDKKANMERAAAQAAALRSQREADDENATFHPTITPYARERSGVGSRSDQGRVSEEFLQQKAERLSRASDRVREAEGASFKPNINQSSREIVEACDATRASEHPSTMMTVENRLTMCEERRREMLCQKIDQAWEGAVRSPKITKKAKALKREGKVSDRLYADANVRSQKLDLLRELEELEQSGYASGGDVSSQASSPRHGFHPRINTYYPLSPTSAERRRRTPVHERLSSLHGQRLSRIQNETQQRLFKEDTQFHRPEINPVSRKLTEKMPQSSFERLTAATGGGSGRAGSSHRCQSSPAAGKCGQSQETEELTFTPRINARSRELEEHRMACLSSNNNNTDNTNTTTTHPSSHNLEARMNLWEERQKRTHKNLERMKHERLQAELEECTFQPQRKVKSPNNSSNNNNNTSTASLEDDLSVAARCTLWQHRKDALLRQRRAVEANLALDECTFTPFVNHDRPVVASTAGHLHEGVDEHVARLRYARSQESLRRAQEQRGTTWSGKTTTTTTTPVEFNFQQRERRRQQMPPPQQQQQQ